MRKNKIALIFLLMFIVSFITINVYADDYPDDIYNGDYSIEDMLRNYSVVTFGQKSYDSKVTKLKSYSPGSFGLFHIVGNFIVKGDLVLTSNNNSSDNEYTVSFSCNKESSTYEICKRSVINGSPSYNYKSMGDNRLSYFEGSTVRPFTNCPYNYVYNASVYYSDKVYAPSNNYFCVVSRTVLTTSGKYINIERLYTNIIEEQKKIKKGRFVSSNNKTAHIETGGEYYIDDINEIDNIIFDNFGNNEEELTVITINNKNSIKFPKIYDKELGEANLIPTNDRIDSNKPNNSYPGNYVLNKYYGNIIWNIPNATYIELPSAPFIGHMIAPKADIEGPELHFAGAFLVNSLSLEGNSEAHFYPLKINNIPYISSIDNYKAIPKVNKNHGNIRFNNNINNELLEEGIVVSFKVESKNDYILSRIEIKDADGNNVEFREVGDGEYEFTMPAIDVTINPQFKEKNLKNIINQNITNPQTRNNIMLVLLIILVCFVFGFRIIKKERNKIM